MKYINNAILVVLCALILIGCAEKERVKNKEITIEPYDMSKNEFTLISKTDVDFIYFFKVNGDLKENENLKYSVEVYENGQLQEVILEHGDEFGQEYQDDYISFGMNTVDDEVLGQKKFMEIISGVPSGRMTTIYPNIKETNTFSKMLTKKIKLEKNKPVYLFSWHGANEGEISSVNKIPKDLADTDLVFLYKVELIEK